MADFSPDMSVYGRDAEAARAANPIGQLGLPGLLGLVRQSRELQTQSAISDAVKNNLDPQTGMVNQPAMMRDLKNSGAYLGSDDVTHANTMQSTQYELQKNYLRDANTALASLITKRKDGRVSLDDWTPIATAFSRAGMPADISGGITASAERHGDDKVAYIPADKVSIAQNWVHDNAALPNVSVQGQFGVENRSAGGMNYQQPGNGAAPPPAPSPGPPPPSSGSSPPPTVNHITQPALPKWPGIGAGAGAGIGAHGAGSYTSVDPSSSYGQKSVDAYTAESEAAAKYSERVYPLRAAIPEMERLGPNGMGPGTPGLQKLKGLMHTYGVDKALGIDMDTVQDYTSAQKNLQRYINQAPNSGHSIEHLASTIAGNPNMEMNQVSAVAISKAILGMERMRQAQLTAFDQAIRETPGMSKANFLDWSKWWNAQQDPRAYAIDTMGPESAAKMMKGMSKDEFRKFNLSRQWAKQTGVLDGVLR
jgi:hypothetical protein